MEKIIRKTSISRYGFVILLISILIGGILYLFTHNNKVQKLQDSLTRLILARENNSLIDSCIINLYSAENYSRLYTVTGNKDYLSEFSANVKRVNDVIDELKLKQHSGSMSNASKLKDLFNQKNIETNNYIKLRMLTDSLISYSANIDNSPEKIEKEVIKPMVETERKLTNDTNGKQDSVKPTKPLSGKLKETTFSSDINSQDKINKQPATNYYQAINQANNNLRKNESKVLMINNSLIGEIIDELKQYKAIDQSYINHSKNELKENLYNISFENKRIFTIALIILLTLTALVFYNIWKIFSNEQKVMEYSKKTEQYALSKSRFLAGMSHEIRTPLNSIIGFSEQLGQDNLDKTQKEQISAIKNSSEMLLGLVNDILDFTKYETEKTTFENSPFVVSKVFADVFKTMQVQASKKHILFENQVNIEKEICCDGDSRRLKQVLMNLLGNAIKFTVKGKVILNASIEVQSKDVMILKVRIEDSGLGIASEDLPNIFEEFTQVGYAQNATQQKGTGLGLAICKKIIELQGGSINVSSEVGKGSVFNFTLPLKKCEFVEIEQTAVFSDLEMTELVGGKRVLFVEDNQLNVLLGRTILKKWKITFDIAYNGVEAFDLFVKNDYDVILTDIHMPEMDGLELTQLIRKYDDGAKAEIPIIALTASVLEEERETFFNSGFNFIVSKPYQEKDLIEKISLSLQSNLASNCIS
ncbi:MAG TPA: ATP-binding protein [Mucilaginibacter sp.]|jgi:signal transduction histidine kinase/CheY-like chemotaxis protein